MLRNAYLYLAIATAMTVIGATLIIYATPPTPPPDPVKVTYFAPDSRIIPAAIDMVNASNGTINVAANVFNDTSFSGVLAIASTRGVTVNGVFDVSKGTSAVREYKTLLNAGGHVWLATIPNTIGNHVFTCDGGTCGTGNYYWSPTAVQAGNYFSIVTGTATVNSFNTTFGTLQASGTAQ